MPPGLTAEIAKSAECFARQPAPPRASQLSFRPAPPVTHATHLTYPTHVTCRPHLPRYNRSVLRPYRGQLPRVHPTAFIDDSAQVIGDVDIGEESSIWMCAVIRGDVHWIKIGRRSNIQDATVVHAMTGTHPTSIGDNVTIGHAAVVHGCTIEHGCLIGMGSILLNGAQIGAGSVVAAGTVITENMKVPPKSLVMGSPGKVKRLLTQAEVAEIQLYADRYVGYRLEYMKI
jgi:carbonic anhydrase/acetyltransferase-like protein (isoleucine patch superfamily)